MSIRYEISVTAECSVCGHKWTPAAWTGLNNVTNVEPTECPKCADEKRKAAAMLRYFPDEVVDLLN